ncbi:MAG: iron ABC transporter permease [Caulobacteraceae bacterium]|nr:iron ABC transporter permease [Caulobacteraceae bacterium]
MSGRILGPALAAVLAASALASLLAGEIWLRPAEVLKAFAAGNPSLATLIVLDIRLPRLLLGMLIGAALGLSGAALQGLLRNPLAEPGLLGVSAGASLGAVIAIYYGLARLAPLASPALGLLGGLVTAGLALGLGRRGGTLALILAGAAVSAIAGACVSLALNLAPNPYAAYEITTWLMGSLADRSWDHVALAAPFIVVGGALLLAAGRALDGLALGEAQAESLGIDVRGARLLILVGTAMSVGAGAAVAGAIGFVGLVAPHLVRPFVGHSPRRALIPAAAAGAAIVTLADIATRLIRVGPEIKLGAVTSLVGAPFFLWLVLHLRRTAP